MLTIILGGSACIGVVMYSSETMILFYSAVYLMCMYEYTSLLKSSLRSQVVSIALAMLIPMLLWGNLFINDYIVEFQLNLLAVQFGTLFVLSPTGFLRGLIGILWTFPAFWCCITLSLQENPLMVVVLMTVIWMTDGFAYMSGKLIGYNKLAPSVSPNKTVEGAFCGVLGSVVIALLISVHYKGIREDDLVNLAVITGVIGQLGDLFESYFKRRLGVKDSSSILWAFGGCLDRFDSILFAMPAAYAYLFYMSFPRLI